MSYNYKYYWCAHTPKGVIYFRADRIEFSGNVFYAWSDTLDTPKILLAAEFSIIYGANQKGNPVSVTHWETANNE